jgi:hypothetical protein
MPQIEYFAISESFAVDRDSGAVSLFNILSAAGAPGFPFELARLVAVACWRCTAEEIAEQREYTVSVTFHAPGRSEPIVERGNFSATSRTQVTIFEIYGATFEREGELLVELALDGQVQETHQVIIKLALAD